MVKQTNDIKSLLNDRSMEQVETGIANLSAMLALLYTGLVTGGVPDEHARDMVIAWIQSQRWNSADNANN